MNIDEMETNVVQRIEEERNRRGGVRGQRELVRQHILALRKYNEIKDVCVSLLEKLATLRNSTVRELYEEFGLSEQD